MRLLGRVWSASSSNRVPDTVDKCGALKERRNMYGTEVPAQQCKPARKETQLPAQKCKPAGRKTGVPAQECKPAR